MNLVYEAYRSRLLCFFMECLNKGVIVKEIKLDNYTFDVFAGRLKKAKHIQMPVYVDRRTYKLILTAKDRL